VSIKPNNKTFYEAMWFGCSREETPIIRSNSLENLVESLLNYTKGGSGTIEVYKIEYNNRGHSIGLVQKFDVLDNFNLIGIDNGGK